MSRLLTSLEASYQPALTAPWAIREIVANAFDGETRSVDHTGVASIEYDPESECLTVTNLATTVPPRALLMGTSDSRDRRDTIGTFGEGLPMALLVLARAGHDVRITNGNELWTPSIVDSPEYDARVLAIDRTEATAEPGPFVVDIDGVSQEQWETARGWFLRLDDQFDPDQAVSAGPATSERVLIQPEMRGRVYNKGVFVMHRQDLQFGYDLDTDLNRDRSIVDTITMQHQTSSLLAGAYSYGRDRIGDRIEAMLFSGGSTTELANDWSTWRWSDYDKDRIAERFRDRYGPDAIPVANMEESQRAEAVGRRGIVSAPLLRKLVKSRVGDLTMLLAANRARIIRTWAWDELDHIERRNLLACQGLVVDAVPKWSPNIRVVEFGSDQVLGRYQADGQIDIAHQILVDREALLTTIVHEVCHALGTDGSQTHNESQVRVLGRICVQMMGGE